MLSIAVFRVVSWVVAGTAVIAGVKGVRASIIPLFVLRDRIRQDFLPGEGPGTPLFRGKGVWISKKGDKIGRSVVLLSERFEELEPFVGERYPMTVREADQLLKRIQALGLNPLAGEDDDESRARVQPALDLLVEYLEEFPRRQ